MALTETWFRPDDPPAITNDIAPIGFTAFHAFGTAGGRMGKVKGRGRGVSCVVRDSLLAKTFKLPFRPITC